MNIGVEIEFTGISTKDVTYALENLWKTYHTEECQPKHLDRKQYHIPDNKDKIWLICEDHSLQPTNGTEILTNTNYEYMCELVTPVLDSNDLTELFNVITHIRNIGGIVNETCGCHIHIDNNPNIKWMTDLFEKALNEQHNILNAFNTPTTRSPYCKPYPVDFIKKYQKTKPTTYEQLLSFIYTELGEGQDIDAIRNPARYYWLNLDSITKRNTIEFRLFNSTLMPEIIQTYISFIKNFIPERNKYVKKI